MSKRIGCFIALLTWIAVMGCSSSPPAASPDAKSNEKKRQLRSAIPPPATL